MALSFDAAEAVVEFRELAQEHIFNAAEIGFLSLPLLPVYLPQVAEACIYIVEAIVQFAAHFGHARIYVATQIADAVIVDEYTDEYNDHRYSRPDRHRNIELRLVQIFSIALKSRLTMRLLRRFPSYALHNTINAVHDRFLDVLIKRPGLSVIDHAVDGFVPAFFEDA
jgi:hypothetical protein